MLRRWPKVLSAGFAVLVAGQVLIANELGGEDRQIGVLAVGVLLLAVGAALTRKLAGWIASAAGLVSLVSLSVHVVAVHSERVIGISGALFNLAIASGDAALVVGRG